jgi:hypothetical protein
MSESGFGLTEDERQERLTTEERQLESRLANKAPKTTVVVTTESEDAARRLELAPDRLEVILVNNHNTETVLQREHFALNKGRIPIAEICKKWRIKDPIWVDIDEPIGTMPDGYSDTSFAGFKILKIRGTVGTFN